MPEIKIIGAGLAGLLAGNMLRRGVRLYGEAERRVPVLYEAQESLPNNHHAVLRFRTEAVSLKTGIAFKRVNVFKAVAEAINPVADALAYSSKVLQGRIEARSVINLETAERFIGPPDLIEQMSHGLNIEYGFSLTQMENNRQPVISTIPMPALMDILGWEGPRPAFKSVPGVVARASVHDCDVYATVYFPHTGPWYRGSITGDELIIESTDVCAHRGDNAYANIGNVCKHFGINLWDVGTITFKEQKYAKIGKLTPEDRRAAKQFMHWATTHFNIYSLGRFATWRAGLLLDDVVDDMEKIADWMQSGDDYARRKGLA